MGVAGEGRHQSRRHVQNHPRTAVSEENIEFLKQGHRRSIVRTPKPMLKRFEQELLKEDWREVRSGVEVKLCQSPDDDTETFILCRSRDRSQKDLGIVRRFEQKIEARLTKRGERCAQQKRDSMKVEREVGRLLGQTSFCRWWARRFPLPRVC